jgi:DNA-directed RNA polymerase specialized sigma24 family protein
MFGQAAPTLLRTNFRGLTPPSGIDREKAMSTVGERSSAGRAGGVQIPPLTRRNSKGETLARTEVVSDQIATALGLDRRALLARLAVLDHKSVEYLNPECLVFLFRHFHAESDTGMAESVASALLKQCGYHIRKKLSTLDNPAARKDAFDDVVTQVFKTALDLGSDAGDYAQVRFWRWLNRIILKAFARAVRNEKRQNRSKPLSAVGEEADEDDDLESGGSAISEDILDPSAWPDQQAMLGDAMKALSSMKPKYAEAFLLRHYHGMQIEDKDENVPTISRYFGKTPETIRNWLALAEQALLQWRKRDQ